MHQEKATLQRQLKPMHVWAVAFGCIVGWGSFINPGKKFLPNSGVAGTAIAMALGALVMIIIAFSYAYMVPKYPQAGGEFTFTKMCFGKRAAYVCGWFLVAAYLTNVPMNSTAIGLIVDGLDGSADILKFGFHYQIAGFDVWLGEMLLAMGILILFGLLNIWGVKKAGIVQSILAALLAASVFTLTAAALISSKANGINMHPIWGFDKSAALAAGAGAANISDFAHTGGKGITSAILATFAIAPWAFVGFDTIPQTAEEFKFSYKKVASLVSLSFCRLLRPTSTRKPLVVRNSRGRLTRLSSFFPLPWLRRYPASRSSWRMSMKSCSVSASAISSRMLSRYSRSRRAIL